MYSRCSALCRDLLQNTQSHWLTFERPSTKRSRKSTCDSWLSHSWAQPNKWPIFNRSRGENILQNSMLWFDFYLSRRQLFVEITRLSTGRRWSRSGAAVRMTSPFSETKWSYLWTRPVSSQHVWWCVCCITWIASSSHSCVWWWKWEMHEMQTLHHRNHTAVVLVFCLMSVNCVVCLHMCFVLPALLLLLKFFFFFFAECVRPACRLAGHFSKMPNRSWVRTCGRRHNHYAPKLDDELSPNRNHSHAKRWMHMVFGFWFSPNYSILICSIASNIRNLRWRMLWRNNSLTQWVCLCVAACVCPKSERLRPYVSVCL